MNDEAKSMTWLDAFLAVWSRWPWVLAGAVGGTVAGLGLSAVSPDLYEARAEIVPTVAGSVLQPDRGDLKTWQADPQLPQIGAHLLRELALSGEALGRLLDRLDLAGEFSADQLAGFLSAEVPPGQPNREPPALHLLARAGSLDQARRRANLWAEVLKDYVDEVARNFADQAEELGARQLAAGSAELHTLHADLHQAMNRARLAVREQEMFLLRQRYGQHLAQLSSLSLLIEIAEAHAQTQVTPPAGTDAEYITARLAARSEALETLHRMVAHMRADAEPSSGEKLAQWDRQLRLEKMLLQELQDRMAASLALDSGTEASRSHQAMVARSMAAVARRLGILIGDADGRSPAPRPALDALVRREWKWEQTPPPTPPTPAQDDDEQDSRTTFPSPSPSARPPVQPDPMLAPIWIPPLVFPADIVTRTDDPQLLADNIRAARIARDRIQSQLVELRREMEAHDAATADHRWAVDQAKRRYEDAREAYDLLAQRVQEARLANLRTTGFMQITSRADRTGRIVSYDLYAYGRTGAVLGVALACMVILTRAAARKRLSG